jgi:uncharacterized iron-regulated membrane protein
LGDRSTHEDPSAKSELWVLAFLFCLAVVFLTAVGFVGFQFYSARRAALFSELRRAEQAQVEAQKEQLRAMEAQLKKNRAKQWEWEAGEKANLEAADEQNSPIR